MIPAMNFGNWLREVIPFLKKHTTPLKEEKELSVVDEIVLHTLRKHPILDTYVTDDEKFLCIVMGDLKISRSLEYRISPGVEYKGELIGILESETVFDLLQEKEIEYYTKIIRAREPEDVKREQEEEARLAQILKEVKGESNAQN